ncbi:MAG: glycoside hydrolase family 127 protein [Ruminococcus flavefaciens]|nr:glycoside hydrolase family 127 protein [Ruminococcus flavefaciens]
MDRKFISKHIDNNKVKINDRFWNTKIELVRKEVIQYQYLALQDKIVGAEKSYCIENFIKAGKVVTALKNGRDVPIYPVDKWVYDENNSNKNSFHGWVFQDSDVYKWIEAVAYSLENHFDDDLKKKADAFIDIICAAQLDNGYIDTVYIINDRNKIFSNLKDHHELYCFGHMAESAVAYFKSTGERKFLDAACKFADLICSTFGNDKKQGYPGHEIAEMALVKLYEVTAKKEYLETAKFFIDERGKKPYYFDIEQGKISENDNYHYNQAHKQPRYQTEAVGHAVRGVYLYSAMADISKFYLDDELFSACKNIWNNIETKKLYITGGIGSTVDGEAFSFNYDLPNDLAYCETCASIGLVFFAQRMAETDKNARYFNVAERALYNTILAGMAEDGKSFFYVNPLEVLPEASMADSRKKHIKAIRQKWFSCACCPPNLARLISSIGSYIFSESDDTVYVNQYIECETKTDKADIYLKSTYLDNGKIDFHIECKKPFNLSVRIPENSGIKSSFSFKERNGYAYFRIEDSSKIDIEFDMYIKIIKCSNRVRENIGKVAVMRGPIVYCLEEVDNGSDLHMLSLCKHPNFEYKDGVIFADGFREQPDANLYNIYSESIKEKCRLKFISYYRWGNRGENEMSVYIRMDSY